MQTQNVIEIVVPDENSQVVEVSQSTNILSNIRPAWKGKSLIQRVERLLPVDPSSACQRIFNASIHDLREKIVIAGLDIAKEVAINYRLPEIKADEDILEKYNVSRIINLAYNMGLLSRPEYRRLTRAYEIRKDLEHEDDEYEAGVEDCVYIFKTCVDVVLAKDPVKLLKLKEIKEIVEQPTAIVLEQMLIEDYKSAPSTRQEEIYQFLISTSLDGKNPDIVRQNSFNSLGTLREYTNNDVILHCSNDFVNRLGRVAPDLAHMRVAHISGIAPYLKNAQKKDFYVNFYNKMKEVGYWWESNSEHGKLLRDFQEVGALEYCGEEEKVKIVKWLVLCYIGEQGGYGDFGYNRSVFYSNSGAPLAAEIIKNSKHILPLSKLLDIKNRSSRITQKCKISSIQYRFDELSELLT